MKVLQITNDYTNTKLYDNLFSALSKQDIESIVFCPNCYVTKVDDNIKIVKCFRKVDRLFYFLKQKKIFKALEGKIKPFNEVNLVHAHTLFTDGNIANKVFKKYGIPYIVAVRNTDINTFYKFKKYLSHLGERIMLDAKAIVFLSNSYKNCIVNKHISKKNREIIEKKSFVIPNGIDDFWHENSNSHQRDKAQIRVIYAGAIDKNKNLLSTARALSLLVEQNFSVSFNAIGRCDNAKILNSLKAYSFFTHKNQMKKEDLIFEYRKSDIFVMPSYYETFGLVYAEAMSQGLPVIYSRGQGFDGQFEEGCVGYRVNSSSYQDIASKILIIVNQYDAISKRCVMNSQKFRWSSISLIYCNLYKSILNIN